MKKITYFIGAIILLLSYLACDEIEGPYTQSITVEELKGDTIPTVILFEFTGWDCVFCPTGHQQIDTIEKYYGERIKSLAIHAGSFATPCEDCPDFRAPEGNEFYDLFEKPGSFPIGAVNSLNSAGLTDKKNWMQQVQASLKETRVANIKVEETVSASELKVKLTADISSEVQGNYNICAFIVENGVIGPQKEMGVLHEEYEHNHMLRTSVSGIFGETISVGTPFTKEYKVQIKDGWEADSLHIVPYIYNTATKQVLPFNIIKTK